MILEELIVENVRSLARVEMTPAPGLNVLLGANGAGKTSLIEALHLLSHGRSFRGRVRDGLIRTGAPALSVFARWREGPSTLQRQIGLRHSGQAWEGRLDHSPVQQLGTLCAAFAVLTFEPGSHALLHGGGEPRRRLLDWGLFHVEPAFMAGWRRYNRALRQRNALLKQGCASGQLDAWDVELAQSGTLLDRLRRGYVERLDARIGAWGQRFLPELGPPRLEYRPGWRRDALSLEDALLAQRDRDRSLTYTSVGPHRADLVLAFEARHAGEVLSRGQAKLAALVLLLAQGEDVAAQGRGWPLMLLDDLASELDPTHRRHVLEGLLHSDAQVIVTGTDAGALDVSHLPPPRVFHVEHGVLSPLSPG